MRIAIVAGPYLPVPPVKYGGTEQVINYLIKGLVEAGHEPILLATADSKAQCEIVPIAEKAIYFAKTPSALARQQKLVEEISAATARKLKELLPRVDIIHSHGFVLEKFKNFPHIVTIHNPITFGDLPFFKAHQNLNYVSVSKNQQKAAPNLNFIAAVHNGEDPSEFPIVLKPDNYVCFLSRLDRGKNPHLAIQLAISLGIRIKVAGKLDHDGVDYFKKEVQPLLDHPLVEWLGEVSQEEKISIVSHAKCNLHPTNFREPFGLTVLEAAYCGTPTLAINRGAMPEIIEQSKTGLLVEDFIEGHYQLKKCFMMDREYIARSSRKRFNYQRMTKEYLAAYQKVLKKG